METANLPKVSKILWSKPVSESTAFQTVARFLEKEQKRLDPVAIQKASHLNDVYLLCEALAKSDNEKDQLECLRNSSTIQIEKETKQFRPSNNVKSSQDGEYLAAADGESVPISTKGPDESPVALNVPSMETAAPTSEPATVKQEIIADEQPSAMQITTHHDNKRKAKRTVEKKAKEEKKRHKNE